MITQIYITREDADVIARGYDKVRNEQITLSEYPHLACPISVAYTPDGMQVDVNGVEYVIPLDKTGSDAIEELAQLGALYIKSDAPCAQQDVFRAPIAVFHHNETIYRGIVLKVSPRCLFVYTAIGLIVFNKDTGEPKPHLSITEHHVQDCKLCNLELIRTYLNAQGRWGSTKPAELPHPTEDIAAWCASHGVVAIQIGKVE